jgi:hypothetical protein
MLALIFAHLFSMAVVREIFARQMQQGKGPNPADGTAPTLGNA